MIYINKAVCKFTGKHLNRGAGMIGLEVPCMYKFAGQESSIESLRTAIYRCSETGQGANKKIKNFNLFICKQCDYTVND